MKGSYFAIERGQLFCLLGPNGAGADGQSGCTPCIKQHLSAGWCPMPALLVWRCVVQTSFSVMTSRCRSTMNLSCPAS